MASRFVDRAVIHLAAGNGGNGCASVHREKFKPLGGPDGGNGGNGGDVLLIVDPNVHTLLDFHFRPHAQAGSGKQGQGSNRNGAAGEHLEMRVPDGTVVLTEDGEILADLIGPGTTFVAAQGGRGGLGNAALASRARKAPGFALLGEEGEARDLVLELRSVADVGLLGFPSAGKSSLVSVISAAKPKIADYPFTTLVPNLGVVEAGEVVFTVADVPGLIPGASEGKGLGLDFLRHIERCAVLVHVVDCATYESGRDPLSDVDALEEELARYTPALGGDLAQRPRLVVLNKVDVPEAAELAELVRPELEQRGLRVFEVSTASRKGLRELTFAMAGVVHEYRGDLPAPEPQKIVLRPHAVDDSGFSVELDPDEENGFVVRGVRPERWVRQTNFANDEAVGYLGDRLNRLGVEEALARRGAKPGNPVTIGGVTFDWEPSTPAGVAVHLSGRGTDTRLEDHSRISAAERKEARRIRRDGPDEDDAPAESGARAVDQAAGDALDDDWDDAADDVAYDHAAYDGTVHGDAVHDGTGDDDTLDNDAEHGSADGAADDIRGGAVGGARNDTVDDAMGDLRGDAAHDAVDTPQGDAADGVEEDTAERAR